MKILLLSLFFLCVHSFTPKLSALIAVEVTRGVLSYAEAINGIFTQWTYASAGFGTPHDDMSSQGVEHAWNYHFPEVTHIFTSMVQAKAEIEKWTAIVDDSADIENEKNLAEAHFDGERFVEGQARILRLRGECITALQQGRASKARENLGRLLHTLQDFYSHSNWVEMGNDYISPNIGYPGGTPYSRDNRSTCRNCKYVFESPLQQTTYDLNNKCLNLCKFGDHNLFLYAASTACVLANAGRTLLPCLPTDCDDSNLLNQFSSYVTSGYYGGSHDIVTPDVEFTKPPDKCTHGGVADTLAYGLEGINKDSLNPIFSPHWRDHPAASRLAITHTKQFLEDLGDQHALVPELTKAQLRLLYGVGAPGYIFAVDTTGSMGTVISSVRTSITDLINLVKGTNKEPSSYTLVPFNDPPDDAVPFQSTDADQFISSLSALTADGGGDCPEPGLHGIYKAIEAAPEGGAVFFFTDAGPNDAPDWINTVLDAADLKKVAVYSFIFPMNCDPDPYYGQGVYERISKQTGGQHYHTSVANAGELVRFVAETFLDPEATPIWGSDYGGAPMPLAFLRRRQEITGVTHDIEIESNLNNVTFSLSGAGNITITEPSGETITSTSPDVVAVTFENVTIITVPAPPQGTWKVAIDKVAAGDNLKVFGSGSFHFTAFDFTELRGTEHPGFFPLNRQVNSKEEIPVIARIERANFTNATFEFRTPDSLTILQTVALSRGSGEEFDVPLNTFYGNVTTPAGQFRVYVVGTTPEGEIFRRVIPQVFGIALNGTTNTTISSNSTSSVNGYNSTSYGWSQSYSRTMSSEHATKTGNSIRYAIGPLCILRFIINIYRTTDLVTMCPVTHKKQVPGGMSVWTEYETSTIRVTSTIHGDESGPEPTHTTKDGTKNHASTGKANPTNVVYSGKPSGSMTKPNPTTKAKGASGTTSNTLSPTNHGSSPSSGAKANSTANGNGTSMVYTSPKFTGEAELGPKAFSSILFASIMFFAVVMF
jgi:von Willebrand factor type A domain